jgi:CRP/FNR family transcriptional regulator, anaerobic regulatory protein
VVLKGSLRVFTIAPNGTEATLYRVEPGETCVLALNCLFNDLLYPAWVQAEAPSKVGVIPGAVYRELFNTERAIQDLTIRALSTLVYRLMAELESIHSCNHRQRLAHHILMNANSEGELQTTQQQIAGHLGTTREVIARLIQEFSGAGYVQTRRGTIAIKDLFGLRRLLSPEALERH